MGSHRELSFQFKSAKRMLGMRKKAIPTAMLVMIQSGLTWKKTVHSKPKIFQGGHLGNCQKELVARRTTEETWLIFLKQESIGMGTRAIMHLRLLIDWNHKTIAFLLKIVGMCHPGLSSQMQTNEIPFLSMFHFCRKSSSLCFLYLHLQFLSMDSFRHLLIMLYSIVVLNREED